MKLWIRSQDKKRLVQIDDIGVTAYNGYYYVIGYKNGNEIELGEYGFHTDTRALEVLDKIQNILYKISDPDLEDVPDLTKLYIPPIMIYEMPEDIYHQ